MIMNAPLPDIKKINLILMPGLNGTCGLFEKFIAQISNKFNVIALSYPIDKKMNYEELASFVRSQIAHIEGPKYLVGESFSGPIALLLLSLGIKEIEGLVLVASFIYPPKPRGFKYVPWELCLGTKIILQQMFEFIGPKRACLFLDILNEIRIVSNSVLAARIRLILSVDVSAALKNVTIPILYLRAEMDVLVPISSFHKIKKLKSIELKTFPTHHFILQALPKESWLEIKDFIERSERLRQ